MLVWCHLCTLMTMDIYLANLITCANGENPKLSQTFDYQTVFWNAISSGILLVNRLDLSLISNNFVVVQSLSHIWLLVIHGLQYTGFPILHCLPEFAQTHVHWVDDAIQPSHSLSSPSPPIVNLSQHQDLFQWVSSVHQMTKVLEFELQHESF